VDARDASARPQLAPAGRPIVGYLHAYDGVPPRVGRSWDIITAGDGVWLAADNPALSLRVPVAPCRIRGLAPLGPACELRHGPVPQACWDEAVALCRWHAARGHEFLVLVMLDARGTYRLVAPWQTPTASRVEYEYPDGLGLPVVHLHSHHALRAFFSATDDADERGLALYGVVGRLDTAAPEVALRAGAFGHWLPLPWSRVFTGNRGAFRDLVADMDTARAVRTAAVSGGMSRPNRGFLPAWLHRLAAARDPRRA
jgi:PRTRC genetic system protein A